MQKIGFANRNLIVYLIFSIVAGFTNCASPIVRTDIFRLSEFEDKINANNSSEYNESAEEDLQNEIKTAKNQIYKKIKKVKDNEAKNIRFYFEQYPSDLIVAKIENGGDAEYVFGSADKKFKVLGEGEIIAEHSQGAMTTIMASPPAPKLSTLSKVKANFFWSDYNEKWRRIYCKLNSPFGLIWLYNIIIPTTWPCMTKEIYDNSEKNVHQRKRLMIQKARKTAVAMGGNTVITFQKNTTFTRVNSQTGNIEGTNKFSMTSLKFYVVNYYGHGKIKSDK
ncbi:MAG: hypothetical protein OEZ34_06935 [Spirochaetia bacterium]|nr:hypothetical protein [Spirochaetia bacterium]